MADDTKELERNLKRFRSWLSKNNMGRVLQGFLPSFLDRRQRLTIVLDDKMSPRTDGKTIWVSLVPPLLADKYSTADWMVVLRAIAAHEAQHVNSSSFVDVREIGEWYGKYLADNFQLSPSIGGEVARNALNIVEDGRIEAIAVQRKPGMLLPFQWLNRVIREGTTITEKAEDPQVEYADFWGNVLSYAKTGLYAPGIQAYDRTDLEANFLAVRTLIDDGVNARSSADCRAAVTELLEEVAPYIAKLVKDSPELQQDLTEGQPEEYTSDTETQYSDPNGQGNGNPLRAGSPVGQSGGNSSSQSQPSGSQPGQSGKNGQNSQDSQSGQNGQDAQSDQSGDPGQDSKDGQDDQDSAGKDGKSDGDGAKDGKDGKNVQPPNKSQHSPMGFCNAQDEAPPIDQDRLDEVRSMMERSLIAANKEAAAVTKGSGADEALSSRDLGDIQACYAGSCGSVNQTVARINTVAELPAGLKAQATRLRRDILRIQASRQKAHKNLRRGALNTKDLWKVGVQNDSIFYKKGDPDSGSIAFYVLIDNSGSMGETCDDGTRSGSVLRKFEAARSAAAVIEEATRGIVPCKVALFNQSMGEVQHQTIRTFADQGRDNRCWSSLLSIGPGGCNADSVNIRIAAQELSKRAERRKVLLVLSDGEPSAYASRGCGEDEVRAAVNDARRKGIVVIPIMFGDAQFLRESRREYEAMYEKHIIASTPQTIIGNLSELFRQVISR